MDCENIRLLLEYVLYCTILHGPSDDPLPEGVPFVFGPEAWAPPYSQWNDIVLYGESEKSLVVKFATHLHRHIPTETFVPRPPCQCLLTYETSPPHQP